MLALHAVESSAMSINDHEVLISNKSINNKISILQFIITTNIYMSYLQTNHFNFKLIIDHFCGFRILYHELEEKMLNDWLVNFISWLSFVEV